MSAKENPSDTLYPSTTVRIPKATLEKLNALSDIRGVSRGTVLRRAIEEYIAAYEDAHGELHGRPKKHYCKD